MEIYIVRHGQTIWNQIHRLQGLSDIELNENGREAARELGLQFKDVPFDIFYSSPLKRAYETASLIRSNRNEIPLVTDERLHEIGFGVSEGTDFAAWQAPESPYHTFFEQPECYIPPEGGESLTDVIDRANDFLINEVEAKADTYSRVMIVAHGAMNKALMCRMEGNDLAHYWGEGLQKNCQATIFKFENGIYTRIG